jgi:hypothetical protein
VVVAGAVVVGMIFVVPGAAEPLDPHPAETAASTTARGISTDRCLMGSSLPRGA